MSIRNVIRKIKEAQKFDVEKETISILQKNTGFIIELLQSQLAKGKDGLNQPITIFGRDYYSDRTVFEKERHGTGLGSVTDYVTSYMTGAFWLGMNVKFSGPNFFIKSDVPYFNKIITQSGEKIMQLSPENLRILSESIVQPELDKRFKARINGNR